MRLFYISFSGTSKVYTEQQFINFIKIAVLYNKDIASFKVIEIDRRLKANQGLIIAQSQGFAPEYYIETQNGFTPFESVISHINLRKPIRF